MARMTVAVALALTVLACFGSAPARAETPTSKEDFQRFYVDYLAAEGYRPEVDSDGDVSFKREGLTYYIIVNEADAEFFELALPNIRHIESEEERQQAYVAADYSNAKSKVSKVYLVNDDVWVTVELFIASPAAFQAVFDRSLSAILNGANNFLTKMNE